MFKKVLSPESFTPTMWAYSHWLSVDMWDCKMIFVTWQIAMDKNGDVVCPWDIEWQTIFIFENISKILKEDEASLDDVVKAVIYVKNISDFSKISFIRNKYFANSKPVSTLVEISSTVKKWCDIEIEVIAIKKWS